MIQNEYFGFGSINKLKDILEKEKAKNIFLITGKDSYSTSGAENALKNLLKQYDVLRFYDFQKNTKIEDVVKGVKLFREKKYDLVVAIGGSSVIDMAKLIAIFAEQREELITYVTGKNQLKGAKVPIVAIPTTAGTGSEATHFAVVYVKKKKQSIAHQSILPKYSILDPDFCMELPLYITASTGIDALSQAIESYWSVCSTDVSKEYSRKAIELILENLDKTVKSPTKESRKQMLLAANLAGKAINIAKTSAPHAISYTLTSYFGIPHGHAVGLTLGEIFAYNHGVSEDDVVDKRGAGYVKSVISELNELLGCRDAEASKEKIKNIMEECSLKTKISDLGVKSEADVELICNNVDPERLKNNPRLLTKQVLKEIFMRIK